MHSYYLSRPPLSSIMLCKIMAIIWIIIERRYKTGFESNKFSILFSNQILYYYWVCLLKNKNLQIHDRSQSWLGTDTSIKMWSPNLASGLQNTPFTHSLEWSILPYSTLKSSFSRCTEYTIHSFTGIKHSIQTIHY